jgi:branched-chain amino acid aminotransferase
VVSTRRPQFVELNGRLLPVARATISVFDRGLLYGDGLFETLRTYHGKAFALDEHVARLQASARLLGIGFPRKAWQRSTEMLLRRNQLHATDAWARITLTRGVGQPGPLPVGHQRPTVLITAGRLDPAIAPAQRRGVRVTLVAFSRSGFLGEHKVLSFLPSVLGKVIAKRHHTFEAVFVNSEGYLTEGTTSNIFVWQRGRLITPPVDGILPGLTRRFVIRAAAADGAPVAERPLAPHELREADEAFLTSSLVEVVPIIGVDGHAIGDGRAGRRTRRLQDLYRQMVDHACGHR